MSDKKNLPKKYDKHDDKPWLRDQTSWDITKFIKLIEDKGCQYTIRALDSSSRTKLILEFQFRDSNIELLKILKAIDTHLKEK